MGAGGFVAGAATFTVLADLSRINYSERMTDRFLIVDFQDPDAGLIKDEETRVCKQPCNFSVSDVFEVHAGAEFRWYRPGFTMAFRGGVFSDPDHPLRFRERRQQPRASRRSDSEFSFQHPAAANALRVYRRLGSCAEELRAGRYRTQPRRRRDRGGGVDGDTNTLVSLARRACLPRLLSDLGCGIRDPVRAARHRIVPGRDAFHRLYVDHRDAAEASLFLDRTSRRQTVDRATSRRDRHWSRFHRPRRAERS